MVERRPELRLAAYCVLLYSIFITWGYLQEKITSTTYSLSSSPSPSLSDVSLSPSSSPSLQQWDFPPVLNLFMSINAALAASTVEFVLSNANPDVHFSMFWKVGLTAVLASPIGYYSLKFINYPMMILSKSSKHVPVMLVGTLFYKQSYPWFKYVSVLMVCSGIALFTMGKSAAAAATTTTATAVISSSAMTIGLLLILLNLSLDGITNNEQDKIFKSLEVTSMQMMKFTNMWQAVYLAVYLSLDLAWNGVSSNLFQAFHLMSNSHEAVVDIVLFCTCGCAGQIIMFGLIKEFGSLVWVTVSVTRQLFTILLSVFIFNHSIKFSQWMAIALVFSGLGMEIFLNHKTKMQKQD